MPILLSALFIIIGIIGISIGFYLTKYNSKIKNWKRINGTILGHDYDTESNDNSTKIKYSFKINELTYNGISSINGYCEENYPVGSKVEIIYDSLNPDRSDTIRKYKVIRNLIYQLLVWGFFFFSAGCITMVFT